MNFFSKPKPTLASVQLQLQTIMSDLSKLNAAIAALQTATSTAVTTIQNLQKPSEDQAGIDAATAAVQKSVDALTATTTVPTPAS